MANIQVMVKNSPHVVEDVDEEWDPRKEDYRNLEVNRYFNGPGADMDVDLQHPSERKPDVVYTLHVANIPRKLTEVGLENLFLNFGTPVNIRSKRDSNRSFAFVEYRSMREAEKAIHELDRRSPFNLRVTFARSEQEKNRLRRQHEEEEQSLKQMNLNAENADMLSFEKELPCATSKYSQPKGIGRGAGRGQPILQAYLQGRSGGNNQAQVIWSQGQPDIIDPGHHIYDPNSCRYTASNQVQQGLYVSLSDSTRKVCLGRGHIPPPQVKNNEQKSLWEVSDGVYRMGGDALVPMGKCCVCSNSTALKCLQCGAFYCSRKCQKEDYPQHARACTPKQSIDIVITSEADRRSVKFGPLISKTKPQSTAWGRPERSVVDVLVPGMNPIFHLTSKKAPNSLFGPLSFTDMSDETDSIVVKLPNALSSTPPEPSFRPVEGQLVGVCGDNSWWRGYVLSTSTGENMFSVALCDRGNIECVNITNIKRLPSEYQCLTELGVKCTLIRSHVTESVIDLCVNIMKEDHDYSLQVIERSGSTVMAKMVDLESGRVLGDVLLERWDPVVEQWSLNSVSLESPCRVVIASYHHQHALYVRPVGKVHQERFFSLLQRVAAVHVQSGPLMRAPYRGEMVACRYTDGNFYRAVVIKESTDMPGEYMVAFVDFGNNGSVAASNMKLLPGELKMHPCCAVKVRLRNVEDRPLTEQAINFLNSLLERELELRLEGTIEEGAVELFHNDGSSINKKLSSLLQPMWKQAVAKGEDIYGGDVLELKDLDVLPLVEDERMIGNSPARILLLDILCDGRIAACPAYSEVLAQVVTTLSSQINEYCGSQGGSARYNPRSGEVCLARFRDGSWYRAVCHKASSYNSSFVTFLDYGNTEEVDHVDIRRIVQEFIRSPVLVSFCHIKGVPDKPTPDVMVALREQLVSNKVYDVIVLKSLDNGAYLVELPDLHLPVQNGVQ